MSDETPDRERAQAPGAAPAPGGPSSDLPGQRRAANRAMLGKLAVITAVMFGFGWAMIPIYKKICEVTGLNVLTRTDEQAADFARNTQVDATRSVVVDFDANGHGPWRFVPEQRSIEVHPGALTTVKYRVVNLEDRTVAGQAIPSYVPRRSAEYFRKVECFCFRQQTLAANETREFPVVFVVDPKLPADVRNITLSYTFFEVAGPVAPQAGAPAATGSGSRGG